MIAPKTYSSYFWPLYDVCWPAFRLQAAAGLARSFREPRCGSQAYCEADTWHPVDQRKPQLRVIELTVLHRASECSEASCWLLRPTFLKPRCRGFPAADAGPDDDEGFGDLP